jgi:C1A family cysteine protease
MPRFIPPGLGWHRDLPDPRDYLPDDPRVRALVGSLKRPKGGHSARPTGVDWREFFPAVEDQLHLASCSAHACLALAGYFARRSIGEEIGGARLFLYKTTRLLLGWPGDRGAPLRETLKALVRFGAPPERLFPYDTERFDDEPPPHLYAFEAETRSIVYARLDAVETTGAQSLDVVTSFLAAGFPCTLGVSLPGRLTDDPEIPAPTSLDTVGGGQAVVAVGYDDKRRVRSSKGALLVRSSWGTSWGEGGHGWLPYEYVRRRLAVDCWTLLKPEWLDSGEFERPLVVS